MWVPTSAGSGGSSLPGCPLEVSSWDRETERGKSNQEPGSVLSRAPALSTIPSFPKPEFKLPGGIPPCQELGGVVVLGVGLTHSPATQWLHKKRDIF